MFVSLNSKLESNEEEEERVLVDCRVPVRGGVFGGWGLGFHVWGVEFRVQGLGFRV